MHFAKKEKSLREKAGGKVGEKRWSVDGLQLIVVLSKGPLRGSGAPSTIEGELFTCRSLV